MDPAAYASQYLKVAAANWTLSNALGSALTLKEINTATRKPGRLLQLAAAATVTDGDVRFGRPGLARVIYEAVAGGLGSIATTASHPPAIIPISTVAYESQMLIYSTAGTCASGQACVGASLEGAPGPLDAYVIETNPSCDVRPTTGFCLLCIRTDAVALHTVYNDVARHTPAVGNSCPSFLAPFQNLVDCAGGYKKSCMGITPESHLFAPIHLVGCNFPLRVVADNGIFRVDQDAAVWTPNNYFLGLGPRPPAQSASLTGQQQLGAGYLPDHTLNGDV